MRRTLFIGSLAWLFAAACLNDRAQLIPPTISCEADATPCGEICVETSKDPKNCGACGVVCASDEVCSAGDCTSECTDGTVACDASCVDLDTDPDHCGGCNEPCPDGVPCSNGFCDEGCEPPLTDCGGSCVDTDSDTNNCGGCGEVCDSGESCSGGTCYARDCATLLANDNLLADGLYTIDPDGAGGTDPFEVQCIMSTDGGGWNALALDDEDNLLMAESSATNPWSKCEDDSAKHFDWMAEGDVVADYDNLGGVDGDYVVPLSYRNPATQTTYSDEQLTALRSIVSELSITTRMVAVTADDDNGDWQPTRMGGHEVYIMGTSMQWKLLTPGEDGECGGGAGTFPAAGSQAGFYLWHQSAAGSEVDGTTGLTNGDLTGLGPSDLLPLQVRLVVATSGGVAFGWERQSFLIK